MFGFLRLSGPRKRLWGTIGGLIIAGSCFKVAYFQYCRGKLVDEAKKTDLTANEHYKEAKEYAAWAAKDREERRKDLPPLSEEQKRQVREYLRIVSDGSSRTE